MNRQDVLADLAGAGVRRTPESVREWLGRESRNAHGVVVQVANLSYVRRDGAGPGILRPEHRVLAAAHPLQGEGVEDLTVQQLLERVNRCDAPLSQRSVYNGLTLLLEEDSPRLRRTDWARYSLT